MTLTEITLLMYFLSSFGTIVPEDIDCRCGSGVEQLTRNEQVVGSIPTNGSTKNKGLSFMAVALFVCIQQ